MRSVAEWVGKTDDSKPPRHVRLRIFDTHWGICHISKRRIQPGEAWDVDHVIAICNGGKNVESNLAPALKEFHKAKTAADVAEKSRVARKRMASIGIKKPRTITAWRRFDGSIKRAGRDR
jgi:5-methylcytosine-specific restriction protein A